VGSGLSLGTRPQGVPGVQGVGQGCQGWGTGVGGGGGVGGWGGVGSPKTHIKCTWFSYKGAANENAFEFCLHNFVFIVGPNFCGVWVVPGDAPPGGARGAGGGAGVPGVGHRGGGGLGGWGGGGGVGSPKTHIKCTWFSYKGAANENAFEFCLHNFVFIVGPNFCGVWVVPGDAPPGGARGAGGGAGVPGGWHRGGGGVGG
jgi:hypothetical protein